MCQVYFPVGPEYSTNTVFSPAAAESIINQKGLNRKHIFDSVKASLKRLQLEYIDVLQCHRFDYTTPIEETVSAGGSTR